MKILWPRYRRTNHWFYFFFFFRRARGSMVHSGIQMFAKTSRRLVCDLQYSGKNYLHFRRARAIRRTRRWLLPRNVTPSLYCSCGILKNAHSSMAGRLFDKLFPADRSVIDLQPRDTVGDTKKKNRIKITTSRWLQIHNIAMQRASTSSVQ